MATAYSLPAAKVIRRFLGNVSKKMLKVNEISNKKVSGLSPKNRVDEIRYYATGNYRQDGRCQTAHAMKEGERWAICKAAREMVKYIPSNAVLIPMPSHTGRATYTKELCRMIARETAAQVCDCLQGTPRETLYSLKQQGRRPTPKKLGFYLAEPLPTDKRVIIVDNVVATGTTAAAAVRAIGGGIVFAYAAATNSRTRNDLERVYPTI